MPYVFNSGVSDAKLLIFAKSQIGELWRAVCSRVAGSSLAYSGEQVCPTIAV